MANRFALKHRLSHRKIDSGNGTNIPSSSSSSSSSSSGSSSGSMMKNGKKILERNTIFSFIFNSKNSWNFSSLVPNIGSFFKISLSIRIASALWTIMNDCDETFNFWEPMHYVVYGKGMQTWEYSGQYSLRSYSFIRILSLPIQFISYLTNNHLVIFYLHRSFLALLATVAEILFYRSLYVRLVLDQNFNKQWSLPIEYYPHVVWMVFQLFNVGTFSQSVSFLPSTFVTHIMLIAYATCYLKEYTLSIIFVAIATLFSGWPFIVVLSLPIVFEILFLNKDNDELIPRMVKNWTKFFFLQKLLYFLLRSFVIFLILISIMTIIDYYYYERITIPSLNILLYNVFNDKTEISGPSLYGTEPFSFYVKNLFLNNNIALVLCCLHLPLSFLSIFFNTLRHVTSSSSSSLNGNLINWFKYHVLPVSGAWLWFIVLSIQEHKEERFLTPILPFILLSATLSIQSIWLLLPNPFYHFKSNTSTHHICYKRTLSTIVLMFVFILISLSRFIQIYENYFSTIDLFNRLNKLSITQRNDKLNSLLHQSSVNFCMGKEWHRFPSSFFLNNPNWNIRWLPSHFHGQLPRYYTNYSNSTSYFHSDFNHLNKEESNRFIHLKKCHFIIDSCRDDWDEIEPNFCTNHNYTSLIQMKIARRQPNENEENDNKFLALIKLLLRIYYIPFIGKDYQNFDTYNLFASKKLFHQKHLKLLVEMME
ncbi:hypothetical protein SNEBB_007595 [Seison nebaliae]|nr:hypothetical protein SNEBB_007595 [Seison nebaliae]